MLPHLAGHLHSVTPSGQSSWSKGWKKADKGSKSWSSQPTGSFPRPLGPTLQSQDIQNPRTGGHVCCWSHQ